MGYFFLLILTALNGAYVSSSTSRKGFQIYMLENYCHDQYFPTKLENISVKLINESYFVRFDINAAEDTYEDLKLEMRVTRCLDKAAPDTCEEFHKFVFPNFCKIWSLPGPWLSYMNNIVPPYTCPVKKGIYRMKKSIECNLKDIERLNFGDGYFFKLVMKIFGMKSNKLYSCFRAEGQK